MNTTKQERKEQAIKLMNQLKIFGPYIEGFKKDDDVCFYEQFGGFWAFQAPELIAKIKEIEQKYNCTVYAITHEFTDFGECYDFLIVTDYKEEWTCLIECNGICHNAFAYVWNKTDDSCSEFGTITIQSFGGGIRRIA